MNTRYLHHIWTKVRPIRPWYFLAAAVVSGIIGIYGLRHNNLTMVNLRTAVYQADQNNGDVQGTLTALQHYVTSHMNTDLAGGPNAVYPPIQLKYTYDRLQQAGLKQASNGQVYQDAQAYCESQNHADFSGRNRVPCIEQYVQSHGNKAPVIPDSLYKFSFISPVWSPDVAGWSLAATALFVVLATGFWLVDRWFKSRVA